MQAYHNDPELKIAFLAQIKAHEDADKIISGTYGEVGLEDFRACAVGCSIQSMNIILGTSHPTNKHSLYPELLGIPTALAKLEDRIFEGLPKEEQVTWPRRFSGAIKVGSDLDSVWPKLAVWLMVDKEFGVINYTKSDKTKKAVLAVSELYSSGDYLDRDKVIAVRKITDVAADAAADAAYAAADAADAAYAAADAAAAYAYAYAYAYALVKARQCFYSALSSALIIYISQAE